MSRKLLIAGILFALAATSSVLVRGATPEEIQRAIAAAKAELRPPAPASLLPPEFTAGMTPTPRAASGEEAPSRGELNADDLPADFQPTPMEGVTAALNTLGPLAGKRLKVFGSGYDARMEITAARREPTLSVVGIEIDPTAAESSRRYVEHAGLDGQIRIITGDATQVNSPADLGIAYLFQDTLEQLKTQIQQLDKFASYAHEVPGGVPGMTMRQIGDIYVYEKRPPVQQVAVQRVPIYANVQGTGVWNGRQATPKRGCNCAMCRSLRSQIAASSGRRVVGYRNVPVQTQAVTPAAQPTVQQAEPRQRVAYQVRVPYNTGQKVCRNGVCTPVIGYRTETRYRWE